MKRALVFLIFVFSVFLSAESKITQIGNYFVTSGSPKEGHIKVVIPKKFFIGEKMAIILHSMNSRFSNNWMVFDYLALKTKINNKTKTLWKIGVKDSPPDYSQNAFKEFCQDKNSWKTQFSIDSKIISQKASLFPKEINDGTTPTIKIIMYPKTYQIVEDCILFVSTLYATHNGTPGFKLGVSAVQEAQGTKVSEKSSEEDDEENEDEDDE